MFPILARSLSSNNLIPPTSCKQGDIKCEHDLMMEQSNDGTLGLMNRVYPWFATVACSFAFVLIGNSKVGVYHLNRSGLHLNELVWINLPYIFLRKNKHFHSGWLKKGNLPYHTLSVFMSFSS